MLKMLDIQKEGTPLRIRPRWLDAESVMCLVSVGLAMGLFVWSNIARDGNPVVVSESFVGLLFMPSAIAAGKFCDQIFDEPAPGTSMQSTSRTKVVHETSLVDLDSNLQFRSK